MDNPWVIYSDAKTTILTPSKKVDHKISNIMIFEPIVEYRYYKSRSLLRAIRDSIFDCKLAYVDTNYVLYPVRQKKPNNILVSNVSIN